MNETTNGYDDIQEAGGLDTTEDVAHITDSEQKENASSEIASAALGGPETTEANSTPKAEYYSGQYDFGPRSGFNRRGFNREGIHKHTGTKFDPEGKDIDGYPADGFDGYGHDKEGYNRLGFNKHGFNKEGYNRLGFNDEGRHKTTGTKFAEDGFDQYGYHEVTGTKLDEDGFKRSGLNRYGFNRDGVHKDTGTNYDPRGFDINGYDEGGYHKDTKLPRGFIRKGNKTFHPSTGEEFDQNGYDVDGYAEDGFDRSGFDRTGRMMKVNESLSIDIKNVLEEFIGSDLTIPSFIKSYGITVADFNKMLNKAEQEFPELTVEAINSRDEKNDKAFFPVQQDAELVKTGSMTMGEFFEEHPKVNWKGLIDIVGPEERRRLNRELVSQVVDGELEPEDIARIFTTSRYNFDKGLKDFKDFKSKVLAKEDEFEKLDKFWKRMRNFHERRSLQGLIGMKITLDGKELVVDDDVLKKAVEYTKRRKWLVCEGRVVQAIRTQMIESDD